MHGTASAALEAAVGEALASASPLVRGVPEAVRRAVADAWAAAAHAPRYVEPSPPWRATPLAREISSRTLSSSPRMERA